MNRFFPNRDRTVDNLYIENKIKPLDKQFLTAEWRKLVMANYVVDPHLLEQYTPAHTAIDFHRSTCYVSLVGFMFLDTRIAGIRVPFHINFEEVNLRFYVRYSDRAAVKRGVVFIKEIVPKPLLALTANVIYRENYKTLPMQHQWKQSGQTQEIEYRWKKSKWNCIRVCSGRAGFPVESGSEEEFITEHYWGYTRASQNKTLEYEVKHPRWLVYPTVSYAVDVDFGNVYGSDFASLSDSKPASVFLAEGSAIEVMPAKRL